MRLSGTQDALLRNGPGDRRVHRAAAPVRAGSALRRRRRPDRRGNGRRLPIIIPGLLRRVRGISLLRRRSGRGRRRRGGGGGVRTVAIAVQVGLIGLVRPPSRLSQHERPQVLGVDGIAVVRRSSVIANVQADDFLERIGTEPPQVAQREEEGEHGAEDPSQYEEQADDVDAEQCGVGRASPPGVEPSDVLGPAVRVAKLPGTREQPDGDHPPQSAEQMDRYGVDRVVDPHLDEELGRARVDDAGDESDDDGRPRFDYRARSGDAHQTREASVEGGGDVEDDLAGPSLGEYGDAEEGRYATGGRGEGGGDRGGRGYDGH
mmetsp:Transcript_3909/g.10767  ORF Transcript_3909/g.10767 Transcript_3909/m.10767 type:complete len:319 (+) Transcript_3909:388-1344(+)